MRSEQLSFTDGTGTRVHVYAWLPDAQPVVAVVQIAHGMSETASRYEPFAEALTREGFAVYANDHRGHGKTAGSPDNLGYLGEDGYNWMVRNMHQLNGLIRDIHAGAPVFLFGHSMGSYLARHYMALYGHSLRGVILSATTVHSRLTLHLATLIAKREMASRGPRARSERLTKLTFGSYNKPFQPNRTPFDWLSGDESEVDAYISNPECGTVCTTSFWFSLFRGLLDLHQPHFIHHTPRNLPIHFIAGDQDSFSRRGKNVIALANVYRKLDFPHITHHLYPNARHELLHDTSREQVTRDIIQWLHEHL